MVRPSFSSSPSYLQYIRASRDLHALTVAGRDDSPEADAIRDSMDQPWNDLSEIEQRRIRGLSEDLYSISDTAQELLPSNPQVQRKLIEAAEARQAGKWDQALELLRRWSRYIDPALLSFLRGTMWQEAGDDATAVLFHAHAAELEPTIVAYQSVYLYTVKETDPTLGFISAEAIIARNEEHPPDVVVIAAGVAFESIERGIGDTRRVTREVIISAMERALDRLEENDPIHNTSFGSVYLLGSVILARCLALTGNLRAAIRSLDQAIAIDPADNVLLLYRGSLRYGVNGKGAADDFEKAIRFGSNVVWPYFYLAHYALMSGHFEDCLRFCEKGLSFSASDDVRALLYEWIAISRVERRYPTDQVRAAFEEAIRLAPDAERIRLNFATFRNYSTNPALPGRDWIRPSASTVQSLGRPDFRLPWPPTLAA